MAQNVTWSSCFKVKRFGQKKKKKKIAQRFGNLYNMLTVAFRKMYTAAEKVAIFLLESNF